MLEAALEARVGHVGENRFDLLEELDSEEALCALRPKFNLMKKLPVRGVIATSASDSPDNYFVSRFFAPALGVDEDQVTGSAHRGLGPRGAEKLGKRELVGYQASERGGVSPRPGGRGWRSGRFRRRGGDGHEGRADRRVDRADQLTRYVLVIVAIKRAISREPIDCSKMANLLYNPSVLKSTDG